MVLASIEICKLLDYDQGSSLRSRKREVKHGGISPFREIRVPRLAVNFNSQLSSPETRSYPNS